MPIFDVPAAPGWEADFDLGDVLAAASYRVPYRLISNGVFDPVYFSTIKEFRGEAAPDLVRIRPSVDGLVDELIVGVVDRNGAGDDGGGEIEGRLAGRDVLALALDKYPAAALTLQGFTVTSAGAQVFNETFQGAASRLLALAGLTAVFECPDYKLGRSVAVTPDRTFAETVAELLRPLRWTEKKRVDAWAEGTGVVRFAERGRAARGTVPVRAARIRSYSVEKTVLQAVTGVRVEGASYEVSESDVPLVGPVAGLPWTSAYTVGFGPLTVSKTVQGVTETWVEQGTEFYDANGRLTAAVRTIEYLTKPRKEFVEKTVTYFALAGDPRDGLKKGESEQFKVWDVTGTNAIGTLQNPSIVRDRSASFEYYSDNGDLRAEDTFEVEFDETAGKDPLPQRARRVGRYRYRRSAGQVHRDVEIEEFDSAGVVTRSWGTTDVAPIRVQAATSSAPVAAPQFRQAQRQVSAGPDPDLAGNLRTERSEMLGAAADCDRIRLDLVDEHASERIGLTASMEPDLRVKVGVVLQVQGAPSWWPVTSFDVTAVRFRYDAEDGLGMDVEAVGWRAVPV